MRAPALPYPHTYTTQHYLKSTIRTYGIEHIRERTGEQVCAHHTQPHPAQEHPTIHTHHSHVPFTPTIHTCGVENGGKRTGEQVGAQPDPWIGHRGEVPVKMVSY